MECIDFKEELRPLYRRDSPEAVLVDVPALNYLIIEGAGDPESTPDFDAAAAALQKVSDTLRATVRRGALRIDYAPMPIEAQWWSRGAQIFDPADRAQALWAAMIMQPDFIAPKVVAIAIGKLMHAERTPELERVRYERHAALKAVQILHTGTRDELPGTYERLQASVRERGFRVCGKYHEIYLDGVPPGAASRASILIRLPVTRLVT